MAAGYETYIVIVAKGDEDTHPEIVIKRNEDHWRLENYIPIGKASSFSEVGQIIGQNFVKNMF